MQTLAPVTPPPHTPSPFKGRGCALRFRSPRKIAERKRRAWGFDYGMQTIVGIGAAPADGALI